MNTYSSHDYTIQKDEPVNGAGNDAAGTTHIDANPVLTWAEHTIDALERQGTALPTIATRTMAMESIAVFDVLSAIHGKSGLLAHLDAPDGISQTAAIAAAAEHILQHAFPNQKCTLRAELSQSLAGVPDGSAEKAGVSFGKSVAEAIISARANDGWDATATVHDGTGAGVWRPTLPNYASEATPQWGAVTPFTLTSADQFRPAGPPDLASAEYAAALNDVKSLGSATSTVRTADQTEIAQFWANDSGTYTAPGHLEHIAVDLAQQQGTSIEGSAQLLAEATVAMADAAIATWEAKSAFYFWRPIEAIRHADSDGNLATMADPDWTPLLPTPGHPEYPSGHATFAGAWAAVMTDFFGSLPLDATSAELPNTTRHFTSFDEAAAEDAQSRIYGGIHYQFSVQDGLALGDKVGDWVLNTFQHDGWVIV
jgi:hypothetical protein